jgi:hypothetical protein
MISSSSSVLVGEINQCSIFEEFSMSKIAAAALTAFAFALIFGTAQAEGLDAIQGAWTTGNSECETTFKRTGSEVAFRDKGSSLLGGVIIRGNRIEGANMSCTAARVKKSDDGSFSVMMNCASAIMFDTVSTGFRVIDTNQFERFSPGFPESTFTYNRCKL